MGLGGHLTWTAAAREIKNKTGKKCLPVNSGQIVSSDIFLNNPNFVTDYTSDCFVLDLGIKETNYCISDTPQKAIHKKDKHMINTICDYYGIPDPELKCDLFFTQEEKAKINELTKELPTQFITIEPHSKTSYSLNRQYPLDKWQLIIDCLQQDIPIVQIGGPGSTVLDGVIDLTGKTSFREAAGIIGASLLFLSNEGGLAHAATAVGTKAAIILGGYTSSEMVTYPSNININVSTHGVCGMKAPCSKCRDDYANYDYRNFVKIIRENLNERN